MQPQSAYQAPALPPLIAPPSANKLAGHLLSTICALSELVSHSPAAMGYFYEDELRRLELRAITHLLQARERAQEILRSDHRLQECIELFIAGTEAIERSPAIPSDEIMLGRRLGASMALQFSRLMLEALQSAYPLAAEADTIALEREGLAEAGAA